MQNKSSKRQNQSTIVQVLQVFVDAVAPGLAGRVSPNFAAWSRDTQETALHMVLKKSNSRALYGVASEENIMV